MKKILMLMTLCCAALVRANCSYFNESDQFVVSSGALAMAYHKAMDLCEEDEYTHFVFHSIDVEGPGGLSLHLHGLHDLDADLISHTLEQEVPDFPPMKIEFEIYCFREKPELEIAAMDVAAFQEFIKAFQEPAEDVEENRVTEISTVEELDECLETAEMPVFVDFYSDTCLPCKILAPQYDQFSIKLSGKGIFLKANIAKAEELCEKYEVESTPTLLIFDGDKVPDMVVGLPSIFDELFSH